MSTMSLVYFGAGVDFEPLIELYDIKVFYYVDALPNTKHYQPTEEGRCLGEWIDNHFTEGIEYALNKLGWQCLEKNENSLLYVKDDKEFHYYMNRNLATDEGAVLLAKHLLRICSHVFMRGYVPDYIAENPDCLDGKVVYLTERILDTYDPDVSCFVECTMIPESNEHPFNYDLHNHFVSSKGYPKEMLLPLAD